LDSGNKSHQLRLAAFLNDNGLKDKALELFYQLAKDYLREERWDDALEVFARIRSINPKDRNANLHIAEVFDKQGKVQRAIEVVIASLAEDPTRTDLLAYLAKLCIKAGKVDEAERLYEKLVKSNRSYLPETLPFVEVLIANKKIEKAVRHLASISQELKDKESQKKCVEYLEEILKLDPQNLLAYQLLEAAYSTSFQFDQLALTLSAHADAYMAKCDYARALVLTKQLVDLEPYTEEYRKKHRFVEKLAKGEALNTKAGPNMHELDSVNKEDEDREIPSPPEVSLDPNLSIVNEEDVENFLTDVELLEKFGQLPAAIARLEKVLQKYPSELQFRYKLKALYLDQRMSKKAAQECLEIAKILQTQDKKEEANKYIREAQRLNPALSTAGKGSSSSAPLPDIKVPQPSDEGYAALKGDLSEISLLDIVQILDTSQKSGRLVVHSEGCEGTIFFNSGKIVDAVYRDRRGEPAMYALVAVKGGSFVYKPSSVSFEVVITTSNTNVILEGLRLLDEANRDSGEFGSKPVEEPLPSPSPLPPVLPFESSPDREPNPTLVSPPKAPFLDENNPLGEW
jgi:tetratricopeptide (TPR) repeat protein